MLTNLGCVAIIVCIPPNEVVLEAPGPADCPGECCEEEIPSEGISS